MLHKVLFTGLLLIVHVCHAADQITILKGEKIARTYSIQRLEHAVKSTSKAVKHIDGQYVYYIESNTPLNAKQLVQLRQILQLPEEDPSLAAAVPLVVTPRPGTISPWSSKATDILHNCGLSNIERIERGKVYYLTPTKDIADVQQDFTKIGALMHDRMTEAVLQDVEHGKVLFAEALPAPDPGVA